jgi:hypothetical protein
MLFQVYTYFGRTLAEFEVMGDETHHRALEESRVFLEQWEKRTRSKAWCRTITWSW